MGSEPDKVNLPARMFSLSTDPAHLRVDGKRLYISGFHSGKLVRERWPGKKAGKETVKELRLDAFEHYRTDRNMGDVREIRTAYGGDLVLANGKIFLGQVFQGTVMVVDQATFTPVKRLPIGGEGCLAASKDGKYVFFASNRKAEFYIIDTKTYEYRTIAYPPGGRGIGCLAVSPDQKQLYLGIQRGGKMRDGTTLSGGNSFLAVYDLDKEEYAGTVYLAQKRTNGRSDDSVPKSLAFSPSGKRLYIGMFQSEAGVLVVDTQTRELVDHIPFTPKRQNPAFPWVDPMSVAVFDRWLLIAIRHNQEIAVVELDSHKVVARITHAAPVDLQRVVVQDDRVYVFGDSTLMSIVKTTDLSKLLRGIDSKKTAPLAVTLVGRRKQDRDRGE